MFYFVCKLHNFCINLWRIWTCRRTCLNRDFNQINNIFDEIILKFCLFQNDLQKNHDNNVVTHRIEFVLIYTICR